MPDDVTSGTHPPSLPKDVARAVARELLAELHPPPGPETPTVVAGAAGGDPPVSRIGPYEVLAPLGRGGMGSVYRARDTRLGRIVALKVFDMGQVPPSEAAERTERFRREANALAKLGRHPHLVQVHELGHEAGRWYFSMDLVEGATLRQWLRAQARTPREVASMVQRVALGLAHAHAHGVIHRDVKPENVFVDQDGEPLLGDFGLVRDLDASQGITEEGQVMGTVAYMAPEQALGATDRIGPWTDVHAMGVILYEGLTGSHPFEGREKTEILAQVLASEPVPLRRRNPRTAPDLEAIVMRCLEKEPQRRYHDAGALAEDLRRWLDGEPVTASRLTPGYWIRKKLHRHRRGLLVACAIAFLGGALTWGVTVGPDARARWRARELLDSAMREREVLLSEDRTLIADLDRFSHDHEGDPGGWDALVAEARRRFPDARVARARAFGPTTVEDPRVRKAVEDLLRTAAYETLATETSEPPEAVGLLIARAAEERDRALAAKGLPARPMDAIRTYVGVWREGRDPAARERALEGLGRLAADLDNLPLARKLLEPIRNSLSPEARRILAVSCVEAGDLAAAEEVADPDLVDLIRSCGGAQDYPFEGHDLRWIGTFPAGASGSETLLLLRGDGSLTRLRLTPEEIQILHSARIPVPAPADQIYHAVPWPQTDGAPALLLAVPTADGGSAFFVIRGDDLIVLPGPVLPGAVHQISTGDIDGDGVSEAVASMSTGWWGLHCLGRGADGGAILLGSRPTESVPRLELLDVDGDGRAEGVLLLGEYQDFRLSLVRFANPRSLESKTLATLERDGVPLWVNGTIHFFPWGNEPSVILRTETDVLLGGRFHVQSLDVGSYQVPVARHGDRWTLGPARLMDRLPQHCVQGVTVGIGRNRCYACLTKAGNGVRPVVMLPHGDRGACVRLPLASDGGDARMLLTEPLRLDARGNGQTTWIAVDVPRGLLRVAWGGRPGPRGVNAGAPADPVWVIPEFLRSRSAWEDAVAVYRDDRLPWTDPVRRKLALADTLLAWADQVPDRAHLEEALRLYREAAAAGAELARASSMVTREQGFHLEENALRQQAAKWKTVRLDPSGVGDSLVAGRPTAARPQQGGWSICTEPGAPEWVGVPIRIHSELVRLEGDLQETTLGPMNRVEVLICPQSCPRESGWPRAQHVLDRWGFGVSVAGSQCFAKTEALLRGACTDWSAQTLGGLLWPLDGRFDLLASSREDRFCLRTQWGSSSPGWERHRRLDLPLPDGDCWFLLGGPLWTADEPIQSTLGTPSHAELSGIAISVPNEASLELRPVPDEPDLLAYRGNARALLGDWPGARSFYQRALDSTSLPGRLRVQIEFWAAMAEFKQATGSGIPGAVDAFREDAEVSMLCWARDVPATPEWKTFSAGLARAVLDAGLVAHGCDRLSAIQDRDGSSIIPFLAAAQEIRTRHGWEVTRVVGPAEGERPEVGEWIFQVDGADVPSEDRSIDLLREVGDRVEVDLRVTTPAGTERNIHAHRRSLALVAVRAGYWIGKP